MTRQLLTYERTQKEDEELTYFDKAVSVYWDCLIDKDSAEASQTSRCTRVAKWSNDYMEYLTTWSKQHPDGHEDEAYIEYLEHETKRIRREAEEDVQGIVTFMMMLEKKFGQDIRTEALKKYNESKYNRTDVPQKQTEWQALHGNLPHKKLTRSRSCPLYYI